MRAPRTLTAFIVFLVGAVLPSSFALAAVSNSNGTNVQQGSNSSTTTQSGKAKSGDAVGGQVTGVVSSGNASVDAKNTSTDSSVSSGDVNGSNTVSAFAGQNFSPEFTVVASTSEITNTSAVNLQQGDNRISLAQSANYTTGDGIAGQVIGVVTSSGASSAVFAANETKLSEVHTGDITGSGNSASAFAGQDTNSCADTCMATTAVTSDITLSCSAHMTEFGCANVQEGDNRITSDQTSTGTTGDGVAGQVIGSVSGGRTSIDARNTSDNVDVTSGSINDMRNEFSAIAGQSFSFCVSTCTAQTSVAEIDRVFAANVQQGSNRVTSSQSAAATTGSAVGGEVIGAVTSAGGSATIAAANTSRNSDVTSGSVTNSGNDYAAFVGQAFALCATTCTATTSVSDITRSSAGNIQQGDNGSTSTQSVSATTGDGIAGQVIGAVSAGSLSIDASNTSTNDSVNSGDATARNDGSSVVGQNISDCATRCEANTLIGGADITTSNAGNVQEGDNRTTFGQAATATSGDGVGGQVIGGVTTAGGSASIVAANTTTNSDITTGPATAANQSASFVGQNATVCFGNGCTANVAVSDIKNVTAGQIQQGDNGLSGTQTASSVSGDGVGGQVLGVVSAGRASVDAKNTSDNVSIETGSSLASNSSAAFVGLNLALSQATGSVTIGDITNAQCADVPCNVQEGANRNTVSQAADASSGDAVAGQVLGVVTTAGGSASVVVDNNSTRIDSTTGPATFENTDASFVGLDMSPSLSVAGFATDVPLLEQLTS